MLLSLHPKIIVHVENVVGLFSSPSTSSQKVRKCGSRKFLSQAIYNRCMKGGIMQCVHVDMWELSPYTCVPMWCIH